MMLCTMVAQKGTNSIHIQSQTHVTKLPLQLNRARRPRIESRRSTTWQICCATMFWDEDDTEVSHPDPYDILDNVGSGEIVEFEQAKRLSNFYGFTYPKKDGTDDAEEHYFLLLKDAEDALAELQAAAPGEKK